MMWIRRELKDKAKIVLKKIYWKAFLVSLVIAIVSGSSGSSGSGNRSNNSTSDPFSSLFIVFMVIGVLLFFVVLKFFLGFPLEVGGRRYFIQSAQFKDNKKCFSFGFSANNYLGIILTMLLKSVQNVLWFLLFIIPWIIKSYSYRMVPYILADNPNIGCKKAIKLSMKMTDGHKFDIFVLDLSFLGWYLLGLLALFVGILFVLPYVNATNAELYLVLREKALQNNMCSYEELLLASPQREGYVGLE